ncbi:MAG: type II toxin-antitoxin system VapC family toxin [Gemmatimonadota bacterium]
MKRYVLDSNLFIAAARDRDKAEELRAFSAWRLPQLHLHAVVAQELIAGATTAKWGHELDRSIIAPYEKRGRIVTPTYRAWKRSGEVLSELIRMKKLARNGVARSFLNDLLIATSCREAGFTLITTNTKDFDLISEVAPFAFLPPWPKR